MTMREWGEGEWEGVGIDVCASTDTPPCRVGNPVIPPGDRGVWALCPLSCSLSYHAVIALNQAHINFINTCYCNCQT